MTAVIFGANGQDGHYLEQICRSRGMDVIGVSRWGPSRIQGDVADYAVVERIIAENKPDYVLRRDGFKSEYPVLVSNPFTMNRPGWNPKINFRQLAELMINYSPQAKL